MSSTLIAMAAENNLPIGFCTFLAEVDAPTQKPDEVIIRVALAFQVRLLAGMPLHTFSRR